MSHPFIFTAQMPTGAEVIRIAYLDNDRIEIEARDLHDKVVARIAYDYCDEMMEWWPCPTYPWAPPINCSLG